MGVGCVSGARMRSVGRFAVLFSNYNDARVAVAPLCRAAAADAATACRLPSSLHSTQWWLVGVSHGFLIAGNRERHMAFLL